MYRNSLHLDIYDASFWQSNKSRWIRRLGIIYSIYLNSKHIPIGTTNFTNII